MTARPAERVYVLLTSGLFSKRFDSSLSIAPATKWFAYSKRPFAGPELKPATPASKATRATFMPNFFTTFFLVLDLGLSAQANFDLDPSNFPSSSPPLVADHRHA